VVVVNEIGSEPSNDPNLCHIVNQSGNQNPQIAKQSGYMLLVTDCLLLAEGSTCSGLSSQSVSEDESSVRPSVFCK
jgi:hypothetical protein